MKFAAGYQYRSSGELFSEMIADYRPAIAEVYFPVPGFASGRPDAAQANSDALAQLIYEVKAIKSMNIQLDMLLNGNCYGNNAVSLDFRNRICNMLEWFASEKLLPEIITTTSPFVADTIKKYKPTISCAVYHRNEDMFEIPLTLAEKYGTFKMYLRHFPYIPAWDTNIYIKSN